MKLAESTFDYSSKWILDNKASIKMPGDNGVPVMVTGQRSLDFSNWIDRYRGEILEALTTRGAILFRGFEIGSAEKFNELFQHLVGDPLDYKNQSSPREKVFKNVYTSTVYPKSHKINMHTDNSYSRDYVRIIAFFCLVPPRERGETPIADERKLLKYLSQDVIQRFRSKKVRYVRNIVPGAGLDWQTVYQTDNKALVNQRLERDKIDYEWLADDHLRLKWVLPAIHPHPITAEDMWFNHMFFYHKSRYAPEILEYFEEEDLPFVSYYGDGSAIEDAVVQQIERFYQEHSIYFKWEKDDFLLLDNMMFSHGRNSYEGERAILTAMAQPLRYEG